MQGSVFLKAVGKLPTFRSTGPGHIVEPRATQKHAVKRPIVYWHCDTFLAILESCLIIKVITQYMRQIGDPCPNSTCASVTHM